jgi:Transposase domain (DUF772)
MSTRMDGIYHRSLFTGVTLCMDVLVTESNRYRILAEKLPWPLMANVANEYRSKVVDIDKGRNLDLRMHLGALIAQSMNGWTDRATEEMVLMHAGVRLLCGLEYSSDSTDHTSIEVFRNQVTGDGMERINQIIVNAAMSEGFTGIKMCSSDTTVQEAPIAYPTEVGHLKNIGEKLLKIGAKIKAGISAGLGELSGQVKDLYTEIRLFTRGKTEKAIEKKKKLGKKLQLTVAKMLHLVQGAVTKLGTVAQGKYCGKMEQYRVMLAQIRQWMKTGFHPKGKMVSLWLKDVRAITREKAGKTTEFGQRWIVTLLEGGYIIGKPCNQLGSGSDTGLMPEVLEHFEKIMGEMPKMVVYDRGGDGEKNHQILEKKKIKNCIFRKGKESQPGIGRNTILKARRVRALSEASIATIKKPLYGFNKPRARSSQSCVLKGQSAILGANLNHLARDLSMTRIS